MESGGLRASCNMSRQRRLHIRRYRALLASPSPAPPSGSITLRYVELYKFRRLGKVQLDLDPQTTTLVGANNSGKIAILTALRHFLAESSPFGAFDISLSEWPALRALGVK